jgi:hypothetical protein
VALTAQTPPPDPLQFLGFRPGSSRAEAESTVTRLAGGWRCAASSVDPRFTECRGTVRSPAGAELALTGSLVSGRLAILLLSAPVSDAEAAGWVVDLATRYGRVEPVHRQGLETWQWVRRRQMIRITAGNDQGQRVVSVSLVDGPLLDGLDRR